MIALTLFSQQQNNEFESFLKHAFVHPTAVPLHEVVFFVYIKQMEMKWSWNNRKRNSNDCRHYKSLDVLCKTLLIPFISKMPLPTCFYLQIYRLWNPLRRGKRFSGTYPLSCVEWVPLFDGSEKLLDEKESTMEKKLRLGGAASWGKTQHVSFHEVFCAISTSLTSTTIAQSHQASITVGGMLFELELSFSAKFVELLNFNCSEGDQKIISVGKVFAKISPKLCIQPAN